MKEEILKILEKYKRCSYDSSYYFEYIDSDDFKVIADDILELLKSQGIIK